VEAGGAVVARVLLHGLPEQGYEAQLGKKRSIIQEPRKEKYLLT
jgi:hypothetical protein